MPTIEAGDAFRFVFVGDTSFVEYLVAGMLKLDVSQSFVVVHVHLPNKLDLGLTGICCRMIIQDGFLVVFGLVIPMCIRLHVDRVGPVSLFETGLERRVAFTVRDDTRGELHTWYIIDAAASAF
jgi:hypothetical protein